MRIPSMRDSKYFGGYGIGYGLLKAYYQGSDKAMFLYAESIFFLEFVQVLGRGKF